MAQDVEHRGGILGHIIVHGAPAVAGHLLEGEVGALAGLFGSQTIGAARAAGLRKIDDLVDRVLLDPQFVRALAMKTPAKSQAVDAAMRYQLGRIGRATALGLAAGQEARQRPAATGTRQEGQGEGWRACPHVLPCRRVSARGYYTRRVS